MEKWMSVRKEGVGRWWFWVFWVSVVLVSLKGAWVYGGSMWRDVEVNERKSLEAGAVGRVHRADGMVVALERQLVGLPEGARVGVVRGDDEGEWRNFGALCGWFLPRGGRTEIFCEGERYDAVVGGMSGVGYPEGWFRKELRGGLCVAKPRGFWKGKSLDVLGLEERGEAVLGWIFGWVVCGVCGGLCFRRVWRVGGCLVERGAVCLCVGALVVSGCQFFGEFLWITQPWRSVVMGVVAMVVSFVIGGWVGSLSVPHFSRGDDGCVEERCGWKVGVKIGVWVLVLWWGMRIAFRAEPDCVPMLGHYGYKARVFFEEGWPVGFPSGREWGLHVPEYPIGVSLLGDFLMGWMCVFCGVDVRELGAILLLNQGLALGGMAVLLSGFLGRCFSRGWLGNMLAMSACVLLFLNGGFLLYFREFYPEPWMLWMGMVVVNLGVVCDLSRERWMVVGTFLFGAVCVVKAEGILWMVAIGFVGLGLGWGRRFWMSWWVSVLVWFVPWKFWCVFHGVGMADYDVSRLWRLGIAEHWERVREMVAGCVGMAGRLVWAYGAWWWFVLWGVLGSLGKSWSGEVRGLWIWGCSYGAMFVSAYFFSGIDLFWHMNGLMRLGSVMQVWSLVFLGVLYGNGCDHAVSERGVGAVVGRGGRVRRGISHGGE